MSGGGWGASPWGAGFWGAGAFTDLELLGALAIRENVVRLTFNTAPQFTRTHDANDAAVPARYNITPIAGTSGRDGEPARVVTPVFVRQAPVELSFGAVIDVTVDRPFSPWDARYVVAVNQLIAAAGGALLSPSASSAEFPGLYRALRPQTLENPLPSRDIANPQTYRDQLDPLPQAGDADALGVFPTGSDGDYAFDEGITNLRKRVFRRLVTRRNAFAHLPGYGVGVPSYGKRLNTAAVRQLIAAEAEQQIGLEPDVSAVKVTLSSDPARPDFTVLVAKVTTTAGQNTTLQLNLPPP